MSTERQFNAAFDVLKRLLESGADVNQLDSAGNPALKRAVLDARQVFAEPAQSDLMLDLHRVFDALLDAGADPEWLDPRSKLSLTDEVTGTGLRPLLRK